MQEQNVLEILVADNDGKQWVVKQPVDGLTYELVMNLEKENDNLAGHLLMDDLEYSLFGRPVTRRTTF